ncbi:MAG: S-layer homology domain-containing protein [Eubacteriales bacterium]
MKKLMAYALSFALVFSQVIPVFASENGGGYSDVDPGHWGADALNYAVENKLLTGTGDGKLDPDGILTRAQLAAILVRLLELDEESDTRFSDVPEGAWFSKYIAKVNKAGLMKGKGNNKMMPNAKVTREEISVILHRLLCIKGGNQEKLSNFSDSSNVSDWAKDAVSSLVDKGYMNGSDGKLNPKVGISRAQLAKLMQNTFPNIVKSEADVKNLKAGNVLVKKSVNLENVEIKGDLILSKAVKPETVLKSTVKISGRVVNPQELKAVAADKLKFTDKGELANKEILQSDNKKDDKKEENSKKDNATRAKRSHSSGSSNGSSNGNQSTAKSADEQKASSDEIKAIVSTLVQLKKLSKLNYEADSFEKMTKASDEVEKALFQKSISKKAADEMAKKLSDAKDTLIKTNEKNVKFGSSYGNGHPYSDLPYPMKVALILDDEGKIEYIEDNKTDPDVEGNYTLEGDREHLKKFLTTGSENSPDAKGWQRFLGKNLEEVKNMKMSLGHYGNGVDADVDATTGATACSIAAQYAVINAIEVNNVAVSKIRILNFVSSKKTNEGYEILFESNLPNDYDIAVEKIQCGIFKDSKEIANDVSFEKKGKDIILKVKGKMQIGKYFLNIKDAAGKYASFGNNEELEEIIYKEIPFSLYKKEAFAEFSNKRKVIKPGFCLMSDIVNNIEEVEVYEHIGSNQKGKFIFGAPILKDSALNREYIEGQYKNNQIFDENGVVNVDFKNEQNENIFENGKEYVLHIHVFGMPREIEFVYSRQIAEEAKPKIEEATFSKKDYNQEGNSIFVSFIAEFPAGYKPKINALYYGIDAGTRQAVNSDYYDISIEDNGFFVKIADTSNLKSGIYFVDVEDESENKYTTKSIQVKENITGTAFEVVRNKDNTGIKDKISIDASGQIVTEGSVTPQDIINHFWQIYMGEFGEDELNFKQLFYENGEKTEIAKSLFDANGKINMDAVDSETGDKIFNSGDELIIKFFGIEDYDTGENKWIRTAVEYTIP